MVVVVLSVASTGCSFDTSAPAPGTDASQTIDAAIADGVVGQADAADAADDASGDALPPDAACVFDVVELCAQAAPNGPLDLNGSFNTDSDGLCRTFTSSGTETCLVLVESAVAGDVSVIGSRPLMLAATGNIELSGNFDISSQRGGQTGAGANFSGCASTSEPDDDVGGSGGGAGGSFAGDGGDGGDGDEDTSLGGDGDGEGGVAGTAVTAPTFARGGCPGSQGGDRSDQMGEGQGGPGGSSGGAVYFVAGGDFSLLGGATIRATGAGGLGGEQQSGGGGGGSGGYVRMDGVNVTLAGNISANGGGGGEGGVRFSNGTTIFGNDGQNGTISAGGAPGGSGAATDGGNGGAGSLMTDPDGSNGNGADGGAGGGGGAGGFVLVRGVLTQPGLSSPLVTIVP
jgi:hypothetical protein